MTAALGRSEVMRCIIPQELVTRPVAHAILLFMRKLRIDDLNPSATELLGEVLPGARVASGEDHHTRSSERDPLVAAWWLMDRAQRREDVAGR